MATGLERSKSDDMVESFQFSGRVNREKEK